MEVASGLPDSCAKYHGYEEFRSEAAIVITVTNLEPSPSQQVACAERYRTHRVNIPLGADFDRGKTYTVKVNEATETFIAGGESANGESSGRVAPTPSEEPTLVRHCIRPRLYAWHGSLPRSPTEDADQREYSIPALLKAVS